MFAQRNTSFAFHACIDQGLASSTCCVCWPGLADPKHLHVPGANELPVSAPCMLAVLKHSFSHVLGIDGDLLNITAAKELKAAGRLCFKPVADSAQQQAQQGHGQGTGSGEEQQEEGDEMCVVQVPEEVDRDRVRWVGLVPCTLRCHIE